MKYKGKIAPWYWAILIIVNGMAFCPDIFGESRTTAILIYIIIADFVLLPPVLRNYVRLEKDELIVCFGFGKDTFKVREIAEIYPTHNPMAASLDGIVIKSKSGESATCTVKKKEELFQELKKKNRKIKIQEDTKKKKKK